MSMFKNIVIICALASFAAGPYAMAQTADSKPIEEKNLISGKQVLDPAKGYIYIQVQNRTNGMFIKSPDLDEIAEYEADWKESFDKAVKKHPGKLKSWKKRREMSATKRRMAGPKPIEPTEESFAIEDIERRMTVSFGPQFVFAKDTAGDGPKTFSYLVEVEPGTFTYYGPLFAANGTQPLGTCYCMGTVKFEVPEGQVTSLGDFLGFQWVTAETARMSSVSVDPEFSPPGNPVDYSVPERLAEFGAQPAELRAAGKMNNYFGVMIGRMPPFEGVLGYERDVPIDLRGLVEVLAAEEGPTAEEADAELVIEEMTDEQPATDGFAEPAA